MFYISAFCSERFIHVHFFLFCFVALISQSSGEAYDFSLVKYAGLLPLFHPLLSSSNQSNQPMNTESTGFPQKYYSTVNYLHYSTL